MNLFLEAIEASVVNELAIYLGGKYKSLPAQAGQCLEWWKEYHKNSMCYCVIHSGSSFFYLE
ncbi:hypothetical protein PGTUg99_020431 [Puccinia graminis f. sp. tritici]|uniref:Uncharacterized protein n=1 Tax=Puccinia graminis f. sp. tritici TaxID=56615 RepID=A0A5B0Q0W4_PUCGR|nr:hypothetical protein PGTUg99_020431 [Puccinia graminis f. sp. tritici]